ncbi:MAG: ABC transporter substrate-binding protein [Acidimicrobiales bacterium]
MKSIVGRGVMPGVVLVSMAVLGAACSTTSTSGTGPTSSGSGAPGVTATAIKVGAVSTLSGPIAANFEAMVPGVEAYFDTVNAAGGVNGRKINMAYSLNTGGNPTDFSSLTQTLINQDHAFAAVGVATAFFKPTYYVQTDTPTFGFNVTGTWTKHPNLFAAGGSVIYYTSLGTYTAYVAKQTGANKVGLLAYGVAGSAPACKAAASILRRDNVTVAYTDLSVPYPGTTSASDVQRMQQDGVNLIVSCMTVTGNITMARAVKQYGMKTQQLWLNGNTQSVLDQYSTLMQGVYFIETHVPFNAPTKYFPGLAQYLTSMKKYEPKYVDDQTAILGWQSAVLFADAVKAAGSNPTQKAVIDAANKMTDFTANGLIGPVDWENAHTTSTPPYCTVYIQAEGKSFVTRFTTGHQVFVCFGGTLKPVTVPAKAGVPGA